MGDGGDQHTQLLYIHPMMLRTIAGAAAVWGIGIPIVVAIKLGDLRLLLLAPLGILLIPVAMIMAIAGRVVLWLNLVLFWYLRGMIAALSLLVFAGVACTLITMPTALMAPTVSDVLSNLPDNAVAIGAVLGIMTLPAITGLVILSRKRGQRMAVQRTSPKSGNEVPLEHLPNSLTYLDHWRDSGPRK